MEPWHVSPRQLGTPDEGGTMEAANEWWRRKQEEIERADPFEQARADLEAIKDQIDEEFYELMLRYINAGNPKHVEAVQQKIDLVAEMQRWRWGKVDLPEEGSGEGLDEIV
jgi:hypothetical protein